MWPNVDGLFLEIRLDWIGLGVLGKEGGLYLFSSSDQDTTYWKVGSKRASMGVIIFLLLFGILFLAIFGSFELPFSSTMSSCLRCIYDHYDFLCSID